jgi:hypothetical protein
MGDSFVYGGGKAMTKCERCQLRGTPCNIIGGDCALKPGEVLTTRPETIKRFTERQIEYWKQRNAKRNPLY